MARRKKDGTERLAELVAEFKAEVSKIEAAIPHIAGELGLAQKRLSEAEMWITSAAGKAPPPTVKA